jgi:hypothetical protein
LALLLALPLAASAQAPGNPGAGATIERFTPADAALSCTALRSQALELDSVVNAGRPAEPEGPGVGQQIVGNVASNAGAVAGQIAGSAFGAWGSLLGRAVGAAGAQTAAQTAMAAPAPPPVDPAVAARAKQAQDRIDSLNRIAGMKGCRASEPDFAGNALNPQQLAALAVPPAEGAVRLAFNPAVLDGTGPLLPVPALSGGLPVAGKRVYVAEYRVLFENAGSITANTRAGYLFRTNYGGTSVRVNYVANLDTGLLQSITDRAWRDFQERARQAGLNLESAERFVAEHGAVYDTTEPASTAAQPVEEKANEGYGARNYLVMAPTGMRLHSRGFTGIGAGNISNRIAYVQKQLEGLSIGYSVNLAATESTGGGSSILKRGSSANASAAMSVGMPPSMVLAQTHANANILRPAQRLDVPGQFANFRETSRFDTRSDALMVGLTQLSRQAGVAANQSMKIDMTVDLDPNAYASLALQGLASFNQALVERLKTGQ